jgi:hypothetical protein
MDEANLIPLYYTVSPRLPDTQVEKVLHCLRITPVVAAIVFDADDVPLAALLCEEVRQVASLSDAQKLALEMNVDGPSIIVSGDVPFEAHYADRIEKVIA